MKFGRGRKTSEDFDNKAEMIKQQMLSIGVIRPKRKLMLGLMVITVAVGLFGAFLQMTPYRVFAYLCIVLLAMFFALVSYFQRSHRFKETIRIVNTMNSQKK